MNTDKRKIEWLRIPRPEYCSASSALDVETYALVHRACLVRNPDFFIAVQAKLARDHVKLDQTLRNLKYPSTP